MIRFVLLEKPLPFLQNLFSFCVRFLVVVVVVVVFIIIIIILVVLNLGVV